MIETLERERITSCTAVPAIYYYLLNHPQFAPAKVAGVCWASYGGAPIAPRWCTRSASGSPPHGSRTGSG
jgi:long-chain acyl-CoA synthetase